jgi:glycosyltransferase involved in cell wall biosynthesis
MKYSLVITYYDPECKKIRMMADLLESIQYTCKDQEPDYELVIVKDGPSYCESVNRGLRRAKGDFIIVMNDDLLFKEKDWLPRLAVPGFVTTRFFSGFTLKERQYLIPDAALFCVPRDIFEQVGCIDERYKSGMNFEDTDYFLTMYQAGVRFQPVDIGAKHLGNETVRTYLSAKFESMREINHQLFNEKWQNIVLV